MNGVVWSGGKDPEVHVHGSFHDPCTRPSLQLLPALTHSALRIPWISEMIEMAPEVQAGTRANAPG